MAISNRPEEINIDQLIQELKWRIKQLLSITIVDHRRLIPLKAYSNNTDNSLDSVFRIYKILCRIYDEESTYTQLWDEEKLRIERCKLIVMTIHEENLKRAVTKELKEVKEVERNQIPNEVLNEPSSPNVLSNIIHLIFAGLKIFFRWMMYLITAALIISTILIAIVLSVQGGYSLFETLMKGFIQILPAHLAPIVAFVPTIVPAILLGFGIFGSMATRLFSYWVEDLPKLRLIGGTEETQSIYEIYQAQMDSLENQIRLLHHASNDVVEAKKNEIKTYIERLRFANKNMTVYQESSTQKHLRRTAFVIGLLTNLVAAYAVPQTAILTLNVLIQRAASFKLAAVSVTVVSAPVSTFIIGLVMAIALTRFLLKLDEIYDRFNPDAKIHDETKKKFDTFITKDWESELKYVVDKSNEDKKSQETIKELKQKDRQSQEKINDLEQKYEQSQKRIQALEQGARKTEEKLPVPKRTSSHRPSPANDSGTSAEGFFGRHGWNYHRNKKKKQAKKTARNLSQAMPTPSKSFQ